VGNNPIFGTRMQPPSVYAALKKQLKADIMEAEAKVLCLYANLSAAEELERNAMARDPTFLKRPEGTLLNWVSNRTPDTYRVAMVMKDGKLAQMKSVTNGIHDAECDCAACLSNPHEAPRPFNITFFDDEYAWRQTLDMENGTIVVRCQPPA